MPRATLPVGAFVQLGAAGRALAQYHGVTSDMVMRIVAVVPRSVYGRKAFAVSVGGETFIAWPSMVRLVIHPKGRKERKGTK
jgi:hypothetical protein